jgi:hypothetical protein
MNTRTLTNTRINDQTKRANISRQGWQAQCPHMLDMAIMERWWRIFAAGFGNALH